MISNKSTFNELMLLRNYQVKYVPCPYNRNFFLYFNTPQATTPEEESRSYFTSSVRLQRNTLKDIITLGFITFITF